MDNVELISSLELAYDVVKKCAPPNVTVESRAHPDSSGTLPLVVVSITPPSNVPSAPNLTAAKFSIVVSCYADTATEALHVCQAVYSSVYSAWRSGYKSPYGWIVHIANDSQHPMRVNSTLDDEDSVRFDAILNVTARHHFTE